ncbi:MAG: leucine-rich repeat protein [Bacteroidales bacterium]|nr:leucine-rich repeat protein [Bacteroidales bacterium]
MKHKLSVFAVLLMALAIPLGAGAQSFSYTYQGNTLNYSLSYGLAEVTGYDLYSVSQSKLVIPDSVEYESAMYPVKTIGGNAFNWSSSFDTVIIPNTVISIGLSAFSHCSILRSVTLGNSVSSIGEYAFYDDSVLVSIYIPASVSSILSSAFSGCKGLTSIEVAAGNTVYDSRGNCNAIIKTSTNELIFGCSVTTIPNTVTKIGHGAFWDITNLTQITIPSSVTILDGGAFRHTGLTSISLPNSVTQIGEHCFYDCTDLATVGLGDSLTSIGDNAFNGDSALTSIVMPNTVTSLGTYAFMGCANLQSVTLSNTLQVVNTAAFKGCTSLTSVVLPSSVDIIRSEAFSGCTNLASVTLLSNTPYGYCYLYGEAFKGCTSLTSISIPDCFHYIGPNAFQHCSALTNVTIGSGITSIGEQAFAYCSAISEIHSRAAVPPTLGTNVFLGVNTSVPVYVPCTSSDYQSATGWGSFSNYQNQPYVLTVTSNGHGTVNVIQPTCAHDTATLTATADNGYIFYEWSDGNTENPRVFHPTSDLTLSATFGPDTCIISALPYTLDFGDWNLYTSCWHTLDQDGDGNGWNLSLYGISGYGLSSASYDNSLGALTPDNWLISPAIELADTTMPQLRWYARGRDANDYAENYTVYVSTTGNTPADFTTVLYTGTTTNEWEEQAVSLSAYVGQRIYIAFRHHECTNMFYLDLDNINFIDLREYLDDACIIDNYPYTMSFEENDTTLGCWSLYDNDGDDLVWTLYSGSPHTGSSSVVSASYNNGPVAPDNWIVSCAFELPANTPMCLSWYARGSHETDFAEHYTVYISTTGNMPTAFSTELYTGNTINAWEQHMADLSQYAGQTVFFAFRHHGCSDMNYLNIDDITVMEAPTMYTLTVNSANATMGTVSGGGTYAEGSTATLTATASNGYHFSHWQDNNTQNPRTVTVSANATYTAYFEENADCAPITSFPWNNTFDADLTCWKTVDADGDGYNWRHYDGYAVSESYSYFDGTNQSLTPDNWLISRKIQIPSTGNFTLSWQAAGLSDSYFAEHYSVYVSTTGGNTPSDFTTPLYSETLNSANAVNRSKSLQNYRGQTIRIAFRHHSSDDVFVLGIANVKITGTQGIDDISEANINIYTNDGKIIVESELNEDVRIYDIKGRLIDEGRKTDFDVPSAGVYVVKVGTHTIQKVVVVK